LIDEFAGKVRVKAGSGRRSSYEPRGLPGYPTPLLWPPVVSYVVTGSFKFLVV